MNWLVLYCMSLRWGHWERVGKTDKLRLRHPKRVVPLTLQSSCLLGLKEESRTASEAGTNDEAQDVRQRPVGRSRPPVKRGEEGRGCCIRPFLLNSD